jgi:predicted nucleic acid-binding protein
VLDASVVLAWALPQEARAAEARALMFRAAEASALVPSLWRLEIGNVLLLSERRGQLLPDEADAILRHLETMPIETDPETGRHAWSTTLALARRHRLTLYDACYLELAQRQGLELASFDAALVSAAMAEKVAIAAAP